MQLPVLELLNVPDLLNLDGDNKCRVVEHTFQFNKFTGHACEN